MRETSMDTAKLWEVARKAALENALKHDGKASQGAVIGAVMQGYPAAKEDMKATAKEVGSILKEINAMSREEQEKELLALDPNYYEKEKEKKFERKEARNELPELEGARQNEAVFRICPEPSKYNHIGHAVNFLINYLYAQKYEGACILRFDDTNPEKETQEYVDAMEEDVLQYLDLSPDQIVFASDHLPKYYEACDDLIERGVAYTCTCEGATMSKNRRAEKACSCRKKERQAVKGEWEDLLSGTQEPGSMTLRLNIDMQHKNAVMRDPVIMRSNHTKHYRQGKQYKVWPMYDFESALEDSWLGATHVLRSNEFETRIELHRHIQSLFNLPHQIIKQYGRFNIVGATTQGRVIREMIEKKEVTGWDDPRLVTLRALKRRGITKKAFYELAKQAGMSKTNTNLGFEVIAAINRKILDEEANRYFFVEDPIKITVNDWPAELTEVELKLHPHNNRGGRKLTLNGEFVISKKDYEQIINGKVFRLIDTINVRYDKEKKVFVVHSETIDEYRKEKDAYGLIHFLPNNKSNIKTKIFMPDATYVEGLCEPTITRVGEGAHVQFERFGFCRLDNKEKNIYWYTHE